MTEFTVDISSMPPRAPSSLPTIHDNRSDISLTSRATVSTSARFYARKTKDFHGYPKVVQANCGFVCANFGSAVEIDGSGGAFTARGLGVGNNISEEEKYGHISMRKTNQSSKHVDFKYSPSMLLPKSRNGSSRNNAHRSSLQEPAIDFMSYITSLRKGSVVPNDPEKLPIIMGPESTVYKYPDVAPQRPNSVMSLSSNLSGSESGSDEGFHDIDSNNNNQTLDENTDYLDNFAENDITRYRWALLRSKLKRRERRKSRSTADGSSTLSEEHNHDEECPICAKAAKQMGGQDVLLSWMINKFGPRELYPKFRNITRGTIPHFCNFVKKVKLKEKENERPQSDHTHRRIAFQDDVDETIPADITSNPVQFGSSKSSTSTYADDGRSGGTGGRPSSPATDDGEEGIDQSAWPIASAAKSIEHVKIKAFLPSVDEESVDDDITMVTIPPTPLPSPRGGVEESNEDHKAFSDMSKNSDNMDENNKDTDKNNILEELAESKTNNESNNIDDENDKLKSPIDNILQEKDNSHQPTVQPVPTPPLPNRSIIEPPPKPHSSPYPHQNVPPKKPRAPIQKKEKKPFERKRQEKADEPEEEVKMEEKEPEPEVKEEVKVPEPPPKPKLEAKVPDLPSFKDRDPKRKKSLGSKRGGREGIKFLSPFDDPNTDKDTLENMKEQRKAFEMNIPEQAKEEYIKQKSRPNTWLQGRLALSQQSSRFELPMDMKILEKMSGVEYLKQYCVISQRRQALYQKVHSRYKDKSGTIAAKELEKALQEVLVNTITTSDIEQMCGMVGLNPEGAVDYKLFAGLAAMAERMLYPKFVTDDTAELKEFKKETIECADFSALDWKLHGIEVNPQVRTILKTL